MDNSLKGWARLHGTAQTVEAEIISGLLTEQSIPVIKRYPDAGEFITEAYGLIGWVEIYVPDTCLSEAQKLLETPLEYSYMEGTTGESPVDEDTFNEDSRAANDQRPPNANSTNPALRIVIHLALLLIVVLLIVFIKNDLLFE